MKVFFFPRFKITYLFTNEDYLNLSITNKYETYNSIRNFNKEFFLRLKYKHNLNVNYINCDTSLVFRHTT